MGRGGGPLTSSSSQIRRSAGDAGGDGESNVCGGPLTVCVAGVGVGRHQSHSNWTLGTKCSSALPLWIPSSIRAFMVQHACFRKFLAAQLHGWGVSRMHVWITWQHTQETICFSAYPLQDSRGLLWSMRMAFPFGQSHGAAVSSSVSQLVWVSSCHRPFGFQRWSIWVVPFRMHQ